MLGLGLGAWCACLCKRQMSGNVCTVVRRMVAAARGGGGLEFCKRCLCSGFSVSPVVCLFCFNHARSQL